MLRKKTTNDIPTIHDTENPPQDQLTTLPDHIFKQIMFYSQDDILNWILINKKCHDMGVESFALAMVEQGALQHYKNFFYKENVKLTRASRFTDSSSDSYLKQKVASFVTAFRRMTIASAIVLNFLGFVFNKTTNEPDPNLELKLTAGAFIFSLFFALIYSDVVIGYEAGKKIANRKREVQDDIVKLKEANISLIARKKDKMTLFASKYLPTNTSSLLAAKIKKKM